MKKKLVSCLLATSIVFSITACGGTQKETAPDTTPSPTENATKEDSDEQESLDDSALNKVEKELSKNFSDVDVSYAKNESGTILYVTAGDGTNSEKLGETLGKLMQKNWFSFDHIMLSQYIEDCLAVSSIIRCSDEQMGYYVWVDDDGNIISDEDQEETPTDDSKNEPTTEKPSAEKTSYGIGETWTVDEKWNFTINSVTVTDERNKFSDQTPEQVLMIDYSYENLGYSGDFMDLYFSDGDMKIIDANGEMGDSYPLSVKNHPQETPVGAKCSNVQACIGIKNVSTEITIQISQYDDNHNEHKAVFKVPVQ